MKGISVIFLVSFVLVTYLQNVESKKMSMEEIRNYLLPVRKICIDRVGVDPKMIDDANNGNFVPDRKLQCYFKCMMLMTKVMKNDKIIEKVLIKTAEVMLNDDLVTSVLDAVANCQPIMAKSLDGCELAYEMAKCYYDFNPAIMFYP